MHIIAKDLIPSVSFCWWSIIKIHIAFLGIFGPMAYWYGNLDDAAAAKNGYFCNDFHRPESRLWDIASTYLNLKKVKVFQYLFIWWFTILPYIDCFVKNENNSNGEINFRLLLLLVDLTIRWQRLHRNQPDPWFKFYEFKVASFMKVCIQNLIFTLLFWILTHVCVQLN